MRHFLFRLLVNAGCILIGTVAHAQEPACASAARGCGDVGLPAANEFDCDSWLSSRETLTGNWHGQRPNMAENGITIDADITQFYTGVVDGGLDPGFRYAGHGDYVVNLDSEKMGGPKGLFVKIKAEHRFGESSGGSTGVLLPANILADLPTPESDNLYLTNVLFTQFFSETFGVFFGKLDTLDGDNNAFAHGRGKTQFSNGAFVITPIGLRTVVYSTLGAGFVILKDRQPIFTFSMLNATNTTRTAGFDELFADGVALIPELRLPTNFFGLPGHQLFAATWSSRNYASLDQSPAIILPNVPIARQSDSWSLYWNFDQYLYTDPSDPSRGWGLFGRAGVADKESNPISSFLSFGVGGNSLLPNRGADTFGAGWYYSRTSNAIAPTLVGALGTLGDGHGAEVYYNAEITPYLHVTADLQVLEPARKMVDTAVYTGIRAVVDF